MELDLPTQLMICYRYELEKAFSYSIRQKAARLAGRSHGVGAMKRAFVICGLIAAGMLAMSPSAKAMILNPGDSGLDNFTPINVGDLTLVDNTGFKTWSMTNIAGQTKATGGYIESVYQDTNNTTSASCGGKCLDFIFWVSNDSTSSSSIEHVSTIDFTGWITDVGYETNSCSSGGTVSPSGASRSADGGTIDFSTSIAPGQASTCFVIETNAFSDAQGVINLIDGGIASFFGFEPVPGPVLGAGVPGLILACGGLIGLARRRRRALALTA